MLTFQIFKFCFLQKVILRVSKCITCDSSSFSCRSFSSTNNNKPRSKLLSLPTISCFDFFFGCSRDGFEELQWARAKVQKNDGTHEFKVAPNLFFFLPLRGDILEKARGEVLTMVEIAQRPRCQGGIGNGQGCSWVKVIGWFRWLSKLILSQSVGEVLAMVDIAPRMSYRGGLRDGQDHSWVRHSFSQGFPLSLF